MRWPSWTAETSAAVQAVAAIAQGILTFVALMTAIGVPWWQQQQERAEGRKRQAGELAGLRQGLYTEVGVVALQCLIELDGWTKAAATSTPKSVRTAKLPQLTIYEANASRVGLLTRNEIVSLIGFAGTLHDISVVVEDVNGRASHRPDESQTLQVLFSNACGNAANFLESVPNIEGSQRDQVFIRRLKVAASSTAATHTAAPRSLLASS